MLTRRQFLAGTAGLAPGLAAVALATQALGSAQRRATVPPFALWAEGKFHEQVLGSVEVFSHVDSQKPDFVLTRHGFVDYPDEFITQALNYEPLAARMVLRLPHVVYEYIHVEGTWVDGCWVGEEWLRRDLSSRRQTVVKKHYRKDRVMRSVDERPS